MDKALEILAEKSFNMKLEKLVEVCDDFTQADILITTILIIRMTGIKEHGVDCICSTAMELLKKAQESFTINLYNNVRDNCMIQDIPFEDDPNKKLRKEIKAEMDSEG